MIGDLWSKIRSYFNSEVSDTGMSEDNATRYDDLRPSEKFSVLLKSLSSELLDSGDEYSANGMILLSEAYNMSNVQSNPPESFYEKIDNNSDVLDFDKEEWIDSIQEKDSEGISINEYKKEYNKLIHDLNETIRFYEELSNDINTMRKKIERSNDEFEKSDNDWSFIINYNKNMIAFLKHKSRYVQSILWEIHCRKLAMECHITVSKEERDTSLDINQKSNLAELLSLTTTIFESLGEEILIEIYDRELDGDSFKHDILDGLNEENHLSSAEYNAGRRIWNFRCDTSHELWMRHDPSWSVDIHEISKDCMVLLECVDYPAWQKIEQECDDQFVREILDSETKDLLEPEISDNYRIARDLFDIYN